MTFDNFAKGQLLAYAWSEGARQGGVDAVLAIAQVLRNRQMAAWQGGEWLKIIATAPHFTGTTYTDTPEMPPRGAVFKQTLQRIDDIFYGAVTDDMTEGGLYYAELHNLNRPWFKANILDNLDAHPHLAKVGFLHFFG